MNPTELLLLEEELKKDLQAIARVRQLMESKNVSAKHDQSTQSAVALPSIEVPKTENDDEVEGPATSLRGTIERLVNDDPANKWTTQKVLIHLQRTGFPLKAKKPIYSVGQSLQTLASAGKIKLTRKGVGSSPNIYRARPRDGAEQNGHSPEQPFNLNSE